MQFLRYHVARHDQCRNLPVELVPQSFDHVQAGLSIAQPVVAQQLLYVDVRRADDFRIETLERLRPDAFIVTYDYAVQAITKQLIQLARERKLPSAEVTRQFVVMGGLLSLGPDLNELDAAVAGYIDRMLRGASPADLPVQMPSRFQLVISRKTAAIIGLPLSPELLLRADEVID